jgi:pyruvate formate lyase activating enzyme
MEIIGKEMTVEELVEIVTRDKPFYDNSGGGVTISGGEPTLQYNFLIALLKGLKNIGIHTAIETCGFFNSEKLTELIELVDLFLFDIKHVNSEIHRQFTGVHNDKILYNFKEIVEKSGSEKICCRIPIIPGINTDLNVIEQIGDFLRSINYSSQVHLMPYNKLAKTKYEKVGMGNLYKDMGELADGKLCEINEVFKKKKFKVIINR